MNHLRFFNYYWSSHYDELISYYPRYYRDVYEMVAILKWCGQWQGSIDASIEQIYNNGFIDCADEQTIERLEKFLKISLHKARPLEWRRRLVKAFFIGFGRLSASAIKAMIHEFTDADVGVSFLPFDEKKNNRLNIQIERGSNDSLYMDDIWMLISRKIPAHLDYRMYVRYAFPVVVGGRDIRNDTYEYPLTGLFPDIATLGLWMIAAAVTDPSVLSEVGTYYKPGIHQTGVIPDDATIGRMVESVIAAEEKENAETYGNERSGLKPDVATLGRYMQVKMASPATVASEMLQFLHSSNFDSAGVSPDTAVLGQLIASRITTRQDVDNVAAELRKAGLDVQSQDGTIGSLIQSTIAALEEEESTATALPSAGGVTTKNIGSGATMTDADMDFIHCGELPL